MTRPQNNNIEMERNDKPSKYRQLAFELRERRTGYTTNILRLIVSALGEGLKETIDLILAVDLCTAIVTDILMDSETIIEKRLSGLVQNELIYEYFPTYQVR